MGLKNGMWTLELSTEEKEKLTKQSLNPEHYAVCEIPVLGLQLTGQGGQIQSEDGEVTTYPLFATNFPVPVEIEKLQPKVIVPGQENKEVRETAPLPPTIRIVLKKDKLMEGHEPLPSFAFNFSSFVPPQA